MAEKDTIRSTYVDMTPELAQRYLETQVHNRNVNEHWVEALAFAMERGDWTEDGNSIKMDSNGHLIDGQHRLRAVIRSGKTLRMEVKSGFPHEAIHVIDSFTRARSTADVLTLDGIPNSSVLASGVKTYYKELRGVTSNSSAYRLSPAIALSVYNEHPGTWQEIIGMSHRINSNKRNRLALLTRSDIVGFSAFLHFDKKHNLPKIERFFEQVCSSSPAENVSIEKLRLALIRNKMSNKSYTRDALRTMIVKTWNAYVTGKSIKSLQVRPDEARVEFI